jgi:V8-like Glu-specific endopeptidase
MRVAALFVLLLFVAMVSRPDQLSAGTTVHCNSDELHNISCHLRNQAGAIPGLYMAGRPVAHLVVTKSNGTVGDATGFLVGNGNYLITNNHVVENDDERKTLEVIFNDELDAYGQPRSTTTYHADQFVWTNIDLDYTIVHIDGNPQSVYGSLPIARRDLIAGEVLRIIQHPNGETKQVSVTECTVADPFLQNGATPYFQTNCDTEEGSSGSPILDENFNVVGLHWGSWNGACPNAGTRIEDLLQDAYANAFVDLETAVDRPADPNDQPPDPGGCKCNKNNNDPPPDCVILEPALLTKSPSSPDDLPPPTLATLGATSDVRAAGTHTVTLTSVSATARTGEITGPFGSVTLNARSVTANGTVSLQRVRPLLRGGVPSNEVRMRLRDLSGTASAIVPIPDSPSWGLSTGPNTFSLDTTVVGRMVCADSAGVVAMSGSCGILLRDIYFSGANPARLFIRFMGYYDFDQRTMTITGLSLRTPLRSGLITVSTPALGAYAVLLLSLLLAYVASRSLSRRRPRYPSP